ncbi:MAG: calcium/sodium antiporter [Pseudomonadales bacterium]|nr:calcium/sodium antiporter [Pseudomonadales bacterium]
MLLHIFLLLIGFLVLFKSADQFVIGSIACAKNFNVSPLIIGLSIVALGTSAPEIFVAAASAYSGEPELAAGNAIGSNIANLGMVLGITAILVPLKFPKETLSHDLPIVIAVAFAAGLVLMDQKLDLYEGVFLLLGLAIFIGRIAFVHTKGDKSENDAVCLDLDEVDEIPDMTMTKAVLYFVSGLFFLLLSAQLLVISVVEIATLMGISELLIGLSIIAVGTSLPELVVSVTSALKGQTELAIGNIMGSNIFNILAVLSIPSLLAPTYVNSDLFWRDYILMIGLTMLIASFAYSKGRTISKLNGLLLLTIWMGYLTLLYYTAVSENLL